MCVFQICFSLTERNSPECVALLPLLCRNTTDVSRTQSDSKDQTQVDMSLPETRPCTSFVPKERFILDSVHVSTCVVFMPLVLWCGRSFRKWQRTRGLSHLCINNTVTTCLFWSDLYRMWPFRARGEAAQHDAPRVQREERRQPAQLVASCNPNRMHMSRTRWSQCVEIVGCQSTVILSNWNFHFINFQHNSRLAVRERRTAQWPVLAVLRLFLSSRTSTQISSKAKTTGFGFPIPLTLRDASEDRGISSAAFSKEGTKVTPL